MNFFGFVITNPIAWAGIFALGIPFLIHLLTRRTPVDIVFPTIRFLQKAKASQSRIFRLRHILLMLLRTAILALLLLAFLKPVYRAGALSETDEGEGSHATIIIVDTSLSMGYTGTGITPLSQAKVAASGILDYLNAGDLANVIFASAQPTASFDAPQSNHYRLHTDIGKATTNLERGGMDEAIAMAIKQLAPMIQYRREIHIVSDFQRTNWASVDFGVIPEEIKVVFVSADEEMKSNSAVIEIRIGPARPSISETVEITCRVANYSLRPQQIPLELHLENKPTEKRTLQVRPGATGTVSFRVNFESPGLYEGRVSIPADGIEEDDTRFFVVPVSERVRVTILTDEPRLAGAASHALLKMALNPYKDDRGSVRVDVVRPDAFDSLAANRSDVIFVVGVQSLSNETAVQLLNFMRDGGGLTYFLSSPMDKANLERLVAESNEELQLPFSVERWIGNREGDDSSYAVLNQANYDNSLLKKFRESGDLADLVFYRYFTTKRAEAQGQVLLRYDNGSIALAQKSLGLGTLLLANFSPDLNSSDIAKHTVFVPLVHEMMTATRPQTDAGRNFSVGEACSTTVAMDSPDAALQFTSPSSVDIDGTVNIGDGESSILFDRTREAGFYRIFSDEKRLGSIAVNIDNRESNLDHLSLAQLEELAADSRAKFYAGSGSSRAALLRLREGTPLWHYMVLAMMCAMLLEQITTLVWKR